MKTVLSVTGITQAIAAIAVMKVEPNFDPKDVTLLFNNYGQGIEAWIEALREDMKINGGVVITSVFTRELGKSPYLATKLFASVGYSFCTENSIPNLVLDTFQTILTTEQIQEAIAMDQALADAQVQATGGQTVKILAPLAGKSFEECEAIARTALKDVYSSLESFERETKINEILED